MTIYPKILIEGFIRSILLCVIVLPSIALATITYDSEGHSSNSNASITVGSGTHNIVFCGIYTVSGTASSVTIGGNSMTQINSTSHAGGVVNTYLYYKNEVSTGANTVTVSGSGIADYGIKCTSYLGDNSMLIDDESVTTNGSSSSITLTVTTTQDNSWLVGFERNESGDASDGTGTTHRGTIGDHSIFDSNGVKSPTGTYSLIQNFSNTSNSGNIASFYEGTGGGGGGGGSSTTTPLTNNVSLSFEIVFLIIAIMILYFFIPWITEVVVKKIPKDPWSPR